MTKPKRRSRMRYYWLALTIPLFLSYGLCALYYFFF